MNCYTTATPSPDSTNYDVLICRGKGYQNSNGNMRYRELIADFSETYKAPTTSDVEKNSIVQTIISTIHSMGGRFYQQRIGGQGFEWEELDQIKLSKKVKQALRDFKQRETTTTNDDHDVPQMRLPSFPSELTEDMNKATYDRWISK